MKYRIWCRVWGGVTGTREAWMSTDGVVREFETRAEAEAMAARMNKERNGLYAVAFFSYTVKEVS